jgi:hypothetical protein
MTSIMDKMQKETENTEIESESKFWFLINLNVAWDLQSIKFENKWNFSDELWFSIADDLEKTMKKIINAIKDKRLEITMKYKEQIDKEKKWFRGF